MRRKTPIPLLACSPDLQTVKLEGDVLTLVLTGGDRPVEVTDTVRYSWLRVTITARLTTLSRTFNATVSPLIFTIYIRLKIFSSTSVTLVSLEVLQREKNDSQRLV